MFLLARILLLQAPWSSDDAGYLGSAKALAEGTHALNKPPLPKTMNPHGLRLGLVLPAALVVWLGGVNYITYYLLPLLFSVLGFVVVLRIGSLFLPPALVVAAGVLHTVLLFEIQHSSALFTDLPAALSLFAYLAWVHLVAMDEEAGRRKLIVGGLIAGLLLFWGYLLRTNQFLLAAPGIVVFLFYRRHRTVVLIGLLFTAALFLGEQLFFLYKGGSFNYRWSQEQQNLAVWRPFFEKVSLTHYFTRVFAFIWRDLGLFALLFYVLAILSQVGLLLSERNALIRALMLSGLFTLALFSFYVFGVDGDKLLVMNAQHRFFQLFYYASMIAVPLGSYRLLGWVWPRIAAAANVERSARPIQLATALLIGLFVISFGFKAVTLPRMLLNPVNSYHQVFGALGRVKPQQGAGAITVVGSRDGLFAVALFSRPYIKRSIRWKLLERKELLARLQVGAARHVLVDHLKEASQIHYAHGKELKARWFNSYRMIKGALQRNYKLVWRNTKFTLYRAQRSWQRQAVPFPNWRRSGEQGDGPLSHWRFHKSGQCQLLRGEPGPVLRCDTKTVYLISGTQPSFTKPPADRDQYRLVPRSSYELSVDIPQRTGDIALSIWIVTFDQRKRHRTWSQNVTTGTTRLMFETGPSDRFFRVLLRISGKGTFQLGPIRLNRLSRTPVLP
ncbi:MAG: hypothetical protein ABI333_26715 [bacterium]